MRVVFVTVDWMKYYVGEGDEEKAVPECGYNFQYVNGYYYGYGSGLEEIALEKCEGLSKEDTTLEGALVVWLAPNRAGDKCIIGWYKDATLYRHAVKELSLENEHFETTFSIMTRAENGVLLPVEERLYAVNHTSDIVHFEVTGLVGSQVMSYIHNYNGDQMNLVLTKKDLEKSLSLNLNYEKYFYKADEFLARDAYGKAIKCFNKATQDEPTETLGYECKGNVLLSLKMYDEAVESFEEVIKRDEESAIAYYSLALLYALKKSYTKALTYYDIYLSKRPMDNDALAEKGFVLYVLQEVEEGRKLIQKAYTNEPENMLLANLRERVMEKRS